MDSNELERERGITILAKTTGVRYHGVKINIVDTPGHSDFGGEVERALKMVDGVMLLVDASEGPLPQTRYVLIEGARGQAAADRGDQQDRPAGRARPGSAERDLRSVHRSRRHRGPARFSGALHQRQEPASPRCTDGRSVDDLRPLFDAILKHIPAAGGRSGRRAADAGRQSGLQRLLGRLAIGRVFNGTLKYGDEVAIAKLDGSLQKTTHHQALFVRGPEARG